MINLAGRLSRHNRTMAILTLFRSCPWPRDSSEVLELADSERYSYLQTKNITSKEINGIEVPGSKTVNIPNVPVSALSYTTKISMDPAIALYYSYAVVRSGSSYWWYWIDTAEVLKRDDINHIGLVSIKCSLDLWSQYGSITRLHDSVVETKTADRWTRDSTLPIYRTPKEHVDGSMDVIASNMLREYVDYTDEGGNYFPAYTRHYFVMYGVVYATKKVNDRMVMVSGLTLSLYGLKTVDGHPEVVQGAAALMAQDIFGTDHLIVSTGAMFDGDLYKDLNIGANNSTLLGAEIIPPLGLIQEVVWSPDTSNAMVLFKSGYRLNMIAIDESSLYWLLDARRSGTNLPYRFNNTVDMMIPDDGYDRAHYTPFAHPTRPGTQEGEEIEIGMAYKDYFEPANYMRPYQKLYLVDACGSIMGEFSDKEILADVEINSFTSLLAMDLSATNTNIYLREHDILNHGDMTIEKGVSVTGIRANVAEDNQLLYRNTQYNADRELHQTQQLVGAINGIMSLFGAGVGGFMEGGPTGAIGASAGAGVGLATSWYSSEKSWKCQQTKIANEPNGVLYSGGVDLPIRLGGGWALVQTRVDAETWRSVLMRHYLEGVDIDETEIGTIDLHRRVGFDYVKCRYARVDVDAPGDIQLAMKRLFEAGIRIYHRVDFFEQDKSDVYQCMENFEVALLD